MKMKTEPHLFYLVGASGSGKDSILKNFRQLPLCDESPVVISHRYITRENTSNEGSVYLSEAEFALRQARGFFSMSWQANGLSYGIGTEIDHWLASGTSVLVNGSRAYLPKAKAKFGQRFHSILIDVPEEILRHRLTHRARENAEAIEQRLKRHSHLTSQINCDSEIENTGSINSGAKKLQNIIHATINKAYQ